MSQPVSISFTQDQEAKTMVWETETANFLNQLSDVQQHLMQVLSEKRSQMLSKDIDAMQLTMVKEQELLERLTELRQQRKELLSQAAKSGLPSDSIHSLASAVDKQQNSQLSDVAKQAKREMRHIQNETLTNFVLAQQTVLHLSQILQIIATGGKITPTYEEENSAVQGGTLVDHEA